MEERRNYKMTTKKYIIPILNITSIIFPFTIGLVRNIPGALESPVAELTIYGYMAIIFLIFGLNLIIKYKMNVTTLISKIALFFTSFYALGCICFIILQFIG